MDKLKDRIIILPVPIGDKVYVPYRYGDVLEEEGGRIVEGVEEQRLSGYIKEGDRELYTTYEEGYGSSDVEAHLAFITREDAEKWLKDNPGVEV